MTTAPGHRKQLAVGVVYGIPAGSCHGSGSQLRRRPPLPLALGSASALSSSCSLDAEPTAGIGSSCLTDMVAKSTCAPGEPREMSMRAKLCAPSAGGGWDGGVDRGPSSTRNGH
jgi:hypothetical protein